MILTGVSLLVTVGILNIYHHSPSKPLPTWVRNVILHGLGRVCCVYTDYVRCREAATHDMQVTVKHLDSVRQGPNQKIRSLQKKTRRLPPRQETVEYLKYLRDADIKSKQLEINMEEWVLVGKVLDRACGAFLVIILMSFSFTLWMQKP